MNELTKATKVRNLLSSSAIQTQISKALPDICKPERFMRIAITAITKNPKLAECTEASLMSCLLDLAQLGIEADGRRAHLIPFGDTCTLIIDYKGIVELVKRGGDVVTIHADKVCANDNFIVDMGEIKKHVIDYTKDRGAVYAYYAYAKMKDGSMQTEVMTKAEVEKIRQGSRGKNSTPWTQHFDEMGKKTVFKRLAKWLPMLPELAQAVERVDKMEFDFGMPQKIAPQADDIQGPPDFTAAFAICMDLAALELKFNSPAVQQYKEDVGMMTAYGKRKQELSK
jgi:recombination protein RecT